MNALIQALKKLNHRTLITLALVGLLVVPAVVIAVTLDLLPAGAEAADAVADGSTGEPKEDPEDTKPVEWIGIVGLVVNVPGVGLDDRRVAAVISLLPAFAVRSGRLVAQEQHSCLSEEQTRIRLDRCGEPNRRQSILGQTCEVLRRCQADVSTDDPVVDLSSVVELLGREDAALHLEVLRPELDRGFK